MKTSKQVNRVIMLFTICSLGLLSCTGSKAQAPGTQNNKTVLKTEASQKIEVTQDTKESLKETKWQEVGHNKPSKGATDNDKLVTGPDGTKYLAFRDFANGVDKITVMSNDKDDADWTVVGNANFSAGRVDNISIAVSNTGIIYVSYTDEAENGRVVVMNYNKSSNTWKKLGDAVSPGLAKDTSIAIDPVTNTPCVAYSDYSSGRNGLAQVMAYDKANNTWQHLGIKEAASLERTEYNSLAIAPDGTIYLAFRTYGFNIGRALVIKYNKDSRYWELCGGWALSNGIADYVNLVIAPDGTPYLAYADQNGGGTAMVLGYDRKNDHWEALNSRWLQPIYFTSCC